MSAGYLKLGVTSVERAIQFDNQCCYRDALSAYIYAIDMFLVYLEMEQNTDRAYRVRVKVSEYVKRAEYLRTML